MRVVYITNDFLDECGGTARHVEELSRRVAASSDVTVLYLSLKGRSGEFIDDQGRQIICLPCPGSLASRLWRFPQRRVQEIIAALQPEIVHLHSPLEAALLKRPHGPAFLYTLHSSVYARLSRYAWWRELVLRGLWKKFDCVIAPSA
ncbi:MAG TPA: glycosyltransferase family 4 protein, partial [Pirellulaceae bacterium]|nr:glycosyltransferase family 4 protein [Pirellulaceae bacterium]